MGAETVNMLLGTGELFFKRVGDASGKYMQVGCLKGNVTFDYEFDTIAATPGDMITEARRDKISERCRLKATICDFKIPQLIASMGQSISTTQLTQTTTLRVWEKLTLKATSGTNATLSRTPVSATSVVVQSLDRQTKYVNGTSYSITSTDAALLKPKCATLANAVVLVSFDYADASATRIKVGDKTTLQIVDLKFTHKLSNGKFITIEIPRATVMGGISIPFNENSDYTTYDITFEGLGSTTATSGESLFKIIREA